jgi:hypothetical protein
MKCQKDQHEAEQTHTTDEVRGGKRKREVSVTEGSEHTKQAS